MTIKPLHDHIVIEYVEAEEEKSTSSIILPSSSKEKPKFATVVAVGSGEMDDGTTKPMIVNVGDKVVIGNYAGTSVKLEDKNYSIIRMSDVLAVIE